jgi:NAD(P)-dependent dehydrogenase (short-subunit alcohol dehydrogenase family)
MNERNGGSGMKAKRVLVTGSGTGVGKGIAIEFGRAGAHVAVHYSASRKGADEAVEQIRGESPLGDSLKVTAIRADLQNLEEVRHLADSATSVLGGVDILINNAGITQTKPFEEVTPEDFDRLYHVNIRAMFFLTQHLAPSLMASGRGVVINVSSVHASRGLPEHTVYAGTKGAIVSFTRTLALELAPKGVSVFGIAPGWVLVEKHIDSMPPGFDYEAAEKLIPSGFISKPEDVGRLALFLASNDARYMIGHTVMFDGGQTAIQPLADRITELFHGALPSKEK